MGVYAATWQDMCFFPLLVAASTKKDALHTAKSLQDRTAALLSQDRQSFDLKVSSKGLLFVHSGPGFQIAELPFSV